VTSVQFTVQNELNHADERVKFVLSKGWGELVVISAQVLWEYHIESLEEHD
jgi:hypothetical protein